MSISKSLRDELLVSSFVTFVCLLEFLQISQFSAASEPTNRDSESVKTFTLPLVSSLESEQAPHGQGNLYAPEVHRLKEGWMMWYGAQGQDGHDRIHAASSRDGKQWLKQGAVVDCGDANHVNDPSVVRVGGIWWMFYTEAKTAEDDQIAAATSSDGLTWQKRGLVLGPGGDDAWDSLKVGRPSVLYENGLFRMWYDGQPTSIAAHRNPAAQATFRVGRAIGYAESADGLLWQRREEPVWISGAGAIHVSHYESNYVMVYESHQGTHWAKSVDGYAWTAEGLLAPATAGAKEASGHVTPFLMYNPNVDSDLDLEADNEHTSAWLFYGAASRPSWNFNRIAARQIPWPASRP